MSFAQPVFAVVAIALAIAFVVFARRAERASRGAALAYSRLAFLEAAAGRTPWTTIFAVAWAIAIAAVGFALARPAIVAALPVHDASVVLCIDTSGSMSSTDVDPSRAEAARLAASTFIDGVPDGTRIGLVAFSTNALPLGPLTDDRATAHDALDRLPPPNGGTAIGDALATAERLLPAAGRRAIVLVTDGVNNHGSDPLEVARTIGAGGTSIFTIGIGTNDSGQLIPGTSESAGIDEDTLRDIARAGNGSYARAADAEALRARLSALAQTSVRERRRVELALPIAIGGGVLAIVVAAGAMALGRFP